jgi:hypothetical protein
MPRPKLSKQEKGISKSISLKPAEWKILKRLGKRSYAAGVRKLLEANEEKR